MSDDGINRRARAREAAGRQDRDREARLQEVDAKNKVKWGERKVALSCHRLGFVLDYRSTIGNALTFVWIGALLVAGETVYARSQGYEHDRQALHSVFGLTSLWAESAVHAQVVVPGALVVFCAAMGLILVSERLVAKAWAAEKAWLAQLPFQVVGFVKEIADVGTSTTHLTLRIDAEVDPGEVVRLLHRVDPEGRVEVEQNRLCLRARVLPNAADNWDARRNAHALFHDLVDVVVSRLNVPVRSVEVQS